MNRTKKVVITSILFFIVIGLSFVALKKHDEPPKLAIDTPLMSVEPPSPPPAVAAPSAELPEVVAEAPPVEQPPPPKTISCRAPREGESSPSADTIQTAITTLIGKKAADRLFVFKSLARHFVVTVDNLPRQKLPRRYVVTRPVVGKFQAIDQDIYENAVLDEKNFERYASFVRLFEKVESDSLVSLYVDFCPLFQQVYEELGYPDRSFHDRLLEVIDHILGTHEIDMPIKLVRPKVFYLFADPELESLSAARKIMIRIGNDNARRIKTKLGELRNALAELSLE